MRILFKHDVPEQKEFENVHGTNFRNTTAIRQLQKRGEWHNGKDDPKDALGKNGDYYINTTSGHIFTKVKGRWA